MTPRNILTGSVARRVTMYRLPTEAEWEYAARAGTTTRYWWGDVIGVALANCADCGGTQDAHAPLPVDGMRPNPFGLVDMLGGVAQWTADCWFPNYQAAPSDGTPREAKNCEKRVLAWRRVPRRTRSDHGDSARQLRCLGALPGQRTPRGARSELTRRVLLRRYVRRLRSSHHVDRYLLRHQRRIVRDVVAIGHQ